MAINTEVLQFVSARKFLGAHAPDLRIPHLRGALFPEQGGNQAFLLRVPHGGSAPSGVVWELDIGL